MASPLFLAGYRVLPKIIGVSCGLPFVLKDLLGSFGRKHIFIAAGGLTPIVFRLVKSIFLWLRAD
jgi:hypothetical protein